MGKNNSGKKKLSPEQRDALLKVLKARFEKNMNRHRDVEWTKVQKKLESAPDTIWTLNEMERTGGEPDVVLLGNTSGGSLADRQHVYFIDCSAESPAGRRSVCYDRAALESRKEHKPKNSAMDMADAMGVALLTEEQYRNLQKTGEYDSKTSSWVMTPPEIRKRGGALFCDRRYGHVFVYHNGADSYYAVRGFRGLVKL